MKKRLIGSIAAAFFAQTVYAADVSLRWGQELLEGQKISGFYLERDDDKTGYKRIATLDPNIRTAVDSTAVLGKTACYRLANFVEDAPWTTPTVEWVSPYSEEACAPIGGVNIYARSGVTVLVSKRPATLSVVSMLVNRDEPVATAAMGSTLTPSGGIDVSIRTPLQLLVSRRATNGSSVVSIMVNQSEFVTVNNKFCDSVCKVE